MLPGAAVATAQQVLLTRARTLDGLSKNDEMAWGFIFEQFITCQSLAVPIFGGTSNLL
jgi:hypothetical protein